MRRKIKVCVNYWDMRYSNKFLICLSFKEEKPEDHPQGSWQEDSETERVYVQEFSFENNTYRVGDFVYVEPSEPNLKPHIVCIEQLWEDKAGNTL